MQQHNILITGSYSGIGKAFVTAYVRDPKNRIIAIDKSFPSFSSPENKSLTDKFLRDVGDASGRRVKIWPMDISDEMQVAELSSIQALELVIHSAGVRGLVPSVPITQGSDVAKAETMDVMTVDTLQSTFNINTIGTFLLLRMLIPKLVASGHGKVVIMGSRMGSIGYDSVGGGYAYRASKAALNAVVKSFSVDVPEVVFCIVHPGRVESNLVGEGIREERAFSAEESVQDMQSTIARLAPTDSGSFMDRWGKEIQW